jgi:hypothetical protein
VLPGHAVAYLVEALCYKQEGRGFESRWRGLFPFIKSSSCTVALGSTQPLTEMSTRDLPVGKGQLEHKDKNLTAICEPTVRKCGSLYVSQPYGPSWPVIGIAKPSPMAITSEPLKLVWR